MLPRSLLERLRERGLDIDYVVDLVASSLELDPSELSYSHAELSCEMYQRGLEFLDRGDLVQACEKIYKAVEEGVKALALANGLPEASEAVRRGRWTVALLDKAAAKLGDDVYVAWDAAFFLHVNCFHEVRVDAEVARAKLKFIAPLVEKVRRLCASR